jgi:hypothetical protein
MTSTGFPGRGIETTPGERLFGESPHSVAEAAAQLDRIARHCLYACDRAGDCVEPDCAAWRLQQSAAEYLVTHWAAAEG